MKTQASIHTALVGRRSLGLEGIASVIGSSRYALVHRCESYVEFCHHASFTPVALCIVVGASSDTGSLCRDLVALRLRNPELCLVAVSPVDDDGDVLMEAGASGHLALSASPEALIMALDYIVDVADSGRGGRQLRDDSRAASHGPQACDHGASVDAFSLRELNVIEGIARGESNKFLARRLRLAESTVKANVRAILRKTGAANRTQIAVLNSMRQRDNDVDATAESDPRALNIFRLLYQRTLRPNN